MLSVPKKTVMITGANVGIGLAVAKHVAAQNHRVILACRDQTKAEAARHEILRSSPSAEVLLEQLDLASFDSIRSCAASIANTYPSLDVLVNNAGVMPQQQQFTNEGFELQFGVNYLGPFLLTHLLLPVLARAPKARIVHVSSIGHLWGRIELPTIYGRKFYVLGIPSYGQSKLGNVLFSHELSRRLPSHITSNAVHPGFVDTEFFRTMPRAVYKVYRTILAPPEISGKFIGDMAVASEWESKTGIFLSAHGPLPISSKTRDRELSAKLYDESCYLTGVTPIAKELAA